MPHDIDMVMDFQWGSTGKGLLCGYLSKRKAYDTAVCAFATNAGHRYVDRNRGIDMVTQQLPTAICSPTVKTILLGPGSLIHPATLNAELARYHHMMEGKRLLIHPHAAIVEDYHRDLEIEWGMTKMGSTAKGVGAAMIERIRRVPTNPNTAKQRLSQPGHFDLGKYVATQAEYMAALEASETLLIEGAQGFSLSMYHGQYPYTTSRDVTPWQLAADVGLPFKHASSVKIWGTLRTFPIRVNNRDGTSGPCYSDQEEITWESLGLGAELTTVTKLPRRIFTFSQRQLSHALQHCGHYWQTNLFLNFANYQSPAANKELVRQIEQFQEDSTFNRPHVALIGYGEDDSQVVTRQEFETDIAAADSEGGEL